MNYDSQLQHAPILGLSAIRASLKNIWDDLALHIPLDLDNNGVYDSTLQFEPRRITATNNSTILRQLGLQRTPYPYPSGSWGDYFNYVKGNESVWRAGYRYYYGGLTLMDYLQSQRPAANQTPDLWKAREQPLTAVKDAVLVFLSYMQQYPTDDKVGLASYTYTDGRGKLEVPLTANYDLVETTSRHRQAAHYHTYTNIAGGMERARQELENNGREGTLKVMVLLSDGHTNWTKSNSYNPTRARREAIDEADMAADIKLPIVTISLGADADTDLMQEIADITKGVHFIVPGGKDVNNYREDLFFIFSLIAADKSLKLVY